MTPSLDPTLRQQAENLAQLEVYEPPILEQIVGFTYKMLGSEEVWVARIWLTFFWLAGGWALWAAGRRMASPGAVITGLGFYFFLPFSVIASRSFQPDSWMVMWILLTAVSAWRWSEKGSWKWAALTGALGGFTLIVKEVAGFYVGGMLVAVVLSTLGWRKTLRSGQVWTMAGMVLLPSLIYYMGYNGQRSADFMSFWTVSLIKLDLTSNFYADWLAMIQGTIGLTNFLLALLGLVLAPKERKPLLAGAWFGYAAYGLVFPYQYTTHEYYHLPLVALTALSQMPLIDTVYAKLKTQAAFWRLVGIAMILFACGYSLWVARSVLYASDYRNEPAAWRKVGEAIPPGSKFTALTADYGMRLRYYGWRGMSVGWPSGIDNELFALAGAGQGEFQSQFEANTEGMDYFLVTAFNELDAQPQLKAYLNANYPVYSRGDGYILCDLKQRLK
jgi:4-amino-4-deoxy-L-arabinose transferase-like glycosyltransferase